ncbi:unnamed protein product [Phytophthora fragariaefolia]|uniref:Unnamed protein product n=1 Tax=Phytophthora fragariaefolia TaxID=1490495 RepID=A0A9W6X769_9STRA|nr:unnamed protein product [Phytophthora fragariaefolia]
MVELPTIAALKALDVLLIALLVLAVDLAVKLWNDRGAQLSPAEQKLLREYNAQVRLVNRLNSVETFVEQAKATRKMNAIKKQLQELAGADAGEEASAPQVCQFFRYWQD